MSAVDVWAIDLDQAPDVVRNLRALLSAEEIARADRPPIASVRQRMVVTRAAARSILATYAGCAPRQLRFGTEARGKPTLERPRLGLDFSISHTEALGLLAVATGRRVGIDVERLRDRPRYAELARQHFLPDEAAAITDVERFLAVWTRKEAYLKGLGVGLLRPLNSFAVTVDEPARLLDAPGWTLHDVVVPTGYVAALAAEGGDDVELDYRCWSPWLAGTWQAAM